MDAFFLLILYIRISFYERICACVFVMQDSAAAPWDASY